MAKPASATPHEVFEVLVVMKCDLRELNAELLAEIRKNREPIRKLLNTLGQHAERIGAMDPGPERDKRFMDETHAILSAWNRDRANLDRFWSRFFGDGLIDQGGSFLEDVLGSINKSAAAATAGGMGVLAGLEFNQPALISAGFGLGIGIVTHAAKTATETIRKSKESPYCFLSQMEDAGVIFRTDVRKPA